MRKSNLRKQLVGGAAAGAIALALAAPAWAQQATYDFNQPSMEMAAAIQAVGHQTGANILVDSRLVSGLRSPELKGALSTDQALLALLDGTGLTMQRTDKNSILIRRASDPQSGSAAGDGADGTVQALIVTAQKREENIQDVPIAMSAFTQEDLTKSQVTGGPDLMTQVPNFTFTKTNFTGYSIQIRGIGTQAISATTDPAVAVAENNTPFIRNRFFEQEFYDLQRVEVLRGPQGTLYGRNATAGVVNIITAKPSFHYEAKLSGDLGNYNSTRIEGMINLPLVEDKVALRLAGAWTKRDGYDTNQITGNRIDGRDLWSTRVSLRITPNDRIDTNLVWEHFEENDDRLRSGKQLCHTDIVTSVAGFPTQMDTRLPSGSIDQTFTGVQGTFSQGCKPASLYSPDAFQVPNGLSLPYVYGLKAIGVPIVGGALSYFDPYASTTQSRNLRVIESTVEPHYQAETNVVEFQFSVDLTKELTLTSETGYGADTIMSTQDFNRFNTASGIFKQPEDLLQEGGFWRENWLLHGPNGGIICDPQIGCADRLVAMDLSTAKSDQFSQELRLASNFSGPLNFSLGANFLRYDTEDKYYVFINTLSAYAELSPYLPGGTGGAREDLLPYQQGVTDNSECMRFGFGVPDISQIQTVNGCEYIDPNPIGSLNDLGHNYFLSKNPYKLISYAVFGEAYYNLAENLKLTAGLRWTVDKKEAPRIPSWLLAADNVGYPIAEVVKQEWRKPTGRVTLDWKPRLSFTDETLLYGSYAHGYKAGGMNPPAPGVVCYFGCEGGAELAEKLLGATHPKTFGPEFVNAFEVGSKNTLLDGRMTLNLAGFYYDYTGYQISQIINRSAVNYNFDSRVWGLEIEADWRPLENLRLGFKGGYENTRVADGMKAIDIMDRTAGDPNWMVVRPFPTFPSNCILPTALFAGATGPVGLGAPGDGRPSGCELAYVLGLDPVTAAPYVDLTTVTGPIVLGSGETLSLHPGYTGWDPATAPNHGAGISKDLSGNSLPNAPHFTATITADYTLPLANDWLMTLHTDLYYQSEAWARIFNTPGYDKLKAFNNVNFAAIFSNDDAGWKVMAYVKNVFDKDNITGAFLNSDDTGLTTNVFLNEPRLYGLRVTKEWTGQGWWTGANPNHVGPYPLTIEIGGMIQHQDAPYQPFGLEAMNVVMPDVAFTSVQNKRLDWGDGRSVKLIYQPQGSPWDISASLRYGRTNNGKSNQRREFQHDDPGICGYGPFGAYAYYGALFAARCDPTSGKYDPHSLAHGGFDWSAGGGRDREEHTLIDFMVGHDVGIGSALAHSRIGGGLRYGEFTSTSSLSGHALGGWDIPEGWAKYYAPGTREPQFASKVHDFTINIDATRKFTGAGPVLSWDAAKTLLGSDETGHVNVDWSMAGGVLFGKQRTSFQGGEIDTLRTGSYYKIWPLQPSGDPVTTSAPAERSKSVSVPVIDLSLGLSYEAGRFSAGAGYRWERYFNVLDGGWAERKQYDRTIDGPYFKIAVGFGG